MIFKKKFNKNKLNTFRLVLFMICFPVMATSMLGLMFDLPDHLPVGVVNLETDCSTPQNVSSKCIKKNLSCGLINEIQAQKLLSVILYNSTEKAWKDGKSGKLNTIFELPRNFTEVLIDRLDLYEDFDDDTIDDYAISDLAAFHLDNTHIHLTQYLQKNLNKAIERFFKKFLVGCGLSKRLARISGVVFQDPIYGSNDGKFTDDLFTVLLLA